MIVLLIILVGFGSLVYFYVFKKDKLNENPPAVNENEIHCKKYKVKIIDQSKVENLAWMDCKNAFQGGIANDGEEICVKRLIYHNPTNLELIELGTCN